MNYLFKSGNRPNFLYAITLVIGFLFTQSALGVVASADGAKTSINQSITIAVLNNDNLEGASSGEALLCIYGNDSACIEYGVSSAPTPPYYGTIALSQDGKSIIYTPFVSYDGTLPFNETFSYTIIILPTQSRTLQSDTASVNVIVTAAEAFEPNREQLQLIDTVVSMCTAYIGSESGPEDLLAGCAEFNRLKDNPNLASEYASAIQSLSGDQITAQTSSTVSLSRDQSANLSSRLEQLRGGVRGFSVSGLSLQNNGERLPGDWLHAIYDTMSGGAAGDETNSNYSPLGLFVNGSISTGDKDETTNERGYDLDSDSYTMGVDYRFSDSLVAGFAYGYGAGEIDFTTVGDDIDNTSHNFTFYGSWFKEQFYLDAALGYATGEIETARRIIITDTITTGKTDTSQIMLQLAGSYDWTLGALSYGPYVRLDLIDGEIDSYAEQNGGGFELAFDKQDINSQLVTLGGQAQYALSYSWGVLLPSARFELKNEFEDERDPIRGRFQLDPDNTQFDINADEVDNFWFQTGVGLSALFTNGISAYIDYETAMGLADTSLSTYSFGGRWELAF